MCTCLHLSELRVDQLSKLMQAHRQTVVQLLVDAQRHCNCISTTSPCLSYAALLRPEAFGLRTYAVAPIGVLVPFPG